MRRSTFDERRTIDRLYPNDEVTFALRASVPRRREPE